MNATADVVIVGAGIVGASIAHECLRHGLGRVAVFDKAPGPGEGSTGASSSICRTRYSNPDVVRLAVHGLRMYREWAAYLDLSRPQARFEESGALWIADRSADEVQREVDRLRDAGASALALESDDLVDRYTAIDPCVASVDLATEHRCRPGGSFVFEDRAGSVDPVQALGDLLTSVGRMGGEVRFGAAVVGLPVTAGRVTGVTLSDGSTVSAGLVVNASGPWCNRINEMGGVEHRWNFTPTRVQTLHHPWEGADLPIVLDIPGGVYLRPDGAGGTLWLGSVREEDERETVADPDDFARSPGIAFRDDVVTRIQHRVPELAARGRVPGIAGLYTINRQDVHPVVGPSGVDGLWLANGFSGHGFKLAPAVGSMVAQALGGTPLAYDTDVPMSLFAIDRSPIGVDGKNVLA